MNLTESPDPLQADPVLTPYRASYRHGEPSQTGCYEGAVESRQAVSAVCGLHIQDYHGEQLRLHFPDCDFAEIADV